MLISICLLVVLYDILSRCFFCGTKIIIISLSFLFYSHNMTVNKAIDRNFLMVAKYSQKHSRILTTCLTIRQFNIFTEAIALKYSWISKFDKLWGYFNLKNTLLERNALTWRVWMRSTYFSYVKYFIFILYSYFGLIALFRKPI